MTKRVMTLIFTAILSLSMISCGKQTNIQGEDKTIKSEKQSNKKVLDEAFGKTQSTVVNGNSFFNITAHRNQ